MGYPPQDKILSENQKELVVSILRSYYVDREVPSIIQEIIDILND